MRSLKSHWAITCVETIVITRLLYVRLSASPSTDIRRWRIDFKISELVVGELIRWRNDRNSYLDLTHNLRHINITYNRELRSLRNIIIMLSNYYSQDLHTRYITLFIIQHNFSKNNKQALQYSANTKKTRDLLPWWSIISKPFALKHIFLYNNITLWLGRIAFFTVWNIKKREFYLEGLLHEIGLIYIIKW